MCGRTEEEREASLVEELQYRIDNGGHPREFTIAEQVVYNRHVIAGLQKENVEIRRQLEQARKAQRALETLSNSYQELEPAY